MALLKSPCIICMSALHLVDKRRSKRQKGVSISSLKICFELLYTEVSGNKFGVAMISQ